MICTFSCFEQQELMRYFFYILDPNQTGVIKKVNKSAAVASIIKKGKGGGGFFSYFNSLYKIPINIPGIWTSFRLTVNLDNFLNN